MSDKQRSEAPQLWRRYRVELPAIVEEVALAEGKAPAPVVRAIVFHVQAVSPEHAVSVISSFISNYVDGQQGV